MPKRGENIRKRKDGRWEARYEKGRRDDGSIIYGYLYAASYEEVKKKKLLALQNESAYCQKFHSVSFTQLCKEWQSSVKCTIKEISYACYHTQIQAHLLPWFSSYNIGSISSELIQQFTMEKLQSGLSARTVKGLLILLQTILKYGEEQKYYSAGNLQIHFPKTSSCMLQVMNEKDIQALVKVLQEDDSNFSLGILICIYTGIREGELCGLQWQDFDFRQGIMHIRRTVSRIRNVNDQETVAPDQPKTHIHISSPKSVSSFRDIPIPDFLLKRLKARCSAPGEFLLTGSTKCMEPRTVQKKFHKLLEQNHIPQINFHSLRHAFATRFTEHGFDCKSLSEILGHSSPKITMEIYVHSSFVQKRNYLNQFHY